MHSARLHSRWKAPSQFVQIDVPYSPIIVLAASHTGRGHPIPAHRHMKYAWSGWSAKKTVLLCLCLNALKNWVRYLLYLQMCFSVCTLALPTDLRPPT